MKPTAKIIVISAFLAFCGNGLANELLVPSQYLTIQSAIDASVDGDTVIVAPGTYTGEGNLNIDFKGKAITVRSQSGPDDCIIDCQHKANGFNFISGEDANSILKGFIIIDGAGRSGGAIICNNGSPKIVDCIITGNSTSPTGAIYCQDSLPEIIDCNIIGNECSGIFCSDSNPTITHCSIIGNSTVSRGGGIYCMSSSPVISYCKIIDNNANYTDGGGICCSGGNPEITNCAIIGNTAREGGGIYGCNGPITNCTIAGNSVTGCSSRGGGLADCSGPITNCTIANNSAEFYGGGLLVKPFSPIKNCIIWNNSPDQIYGDYIPVPITYSDVQGGYPGLGNIDVDPCFVDADANDYHLKSEGWSWDIVRHCWTYDDVTSRCIDAGNPGSPLGDELLAVPRDPNNIWGQNLRIDMGAFGGTAEASIPPYDWALLSDVTNDGISDYSDIDILSSLWLNSGEQLYADFNRDEIINLFDFALLAQDWLEQTTWHE